MWSSVKVLEFILIGGGYVALKTIAGIYGAGTIVFAGAYGIKKLSQGDEQEQQRVDTPAIDVSIPDAKQAMGKSNEKIKTVNETIDNSCKSFCDSVEKLSELTPGIEKTNLELMDTASLLKKAAENIGDDARPVLDELEKRLNSLNDYEKQLYAQKEKIDALLKDVPSDNNNLQAEFTKLKSEYQKLSDQSQQKIQRLMLINKKLTQALNETVSSKAADPQQSHVFFKSYQ